MKCGLHNFEVDGRHLRADDGVVFAHLFGKGYLFNGSGVGNRVFPGFLTHPYCGQQGAYPNSGCPQIIDLVYF